MTDPRRTNKPTVKQLRFLRRLAAERGESFTMPTTRAQASSEISRLMSRRRTSYVDIRREQLDVSRGLATERGGAAAVGVAEVMGYGSSARWANGRKR